MSWLWWPLYIDFDSYRFVHRFRSLFRPSSTFDETTRWQTGRRTNSFSSLFEQVVERRFFFFFSFRYETKMNVLPKDRTEILNLINEWNSTRLDLFKISEPNDVKRQKFVFEFDLKKIFVFVRRFWSFTALCDFIFKMLKTKWQQNAFESPVRRRRWTLFAFWWKNYDPIWKRCRMKKIFAFSKFIRTEVRRKRFETNERIVFRRIFRRSKIRNGRKTVVGSNFLG